MILCHLTDDEGKAGIEQFGFAKSHPRDSLNKAWFWDCERSDPYLTTYLLSFEVVNQFQPFVFKKFRPPPIYGI